MKLPAFLLCLLLLGIGFTIMQIPDQTPEEEDHALMEKAATKLEQCIADMIHWGDMTREYCEFFIDKEVLKDEQQMQRMRSTDKMGRDGIR